MTFNHLILKDYVFPSPSILYLKEAFSVLSFYFLKAFSAASVRPLSDYFITVLDNSNKLPKAEQMRAVEEFFSNEVLVVGIQPPPSTY